MNFVKVLQCKELGFGSREVKPFAKEPLIKLLIRTRWAFAESLNIHSDHMVLLGGGWFSPKFRVTGSPNFNSILV